MFAVIRQFLQRVRFAQLLRIVVYSTLGFFATVAALTYAGMAATALIRRRRDFRFPHKPLDPVWVDGERLKIFNYGHVTFKDMLEVIDRAEESIFLETYILKSARRGRGSRFTWPSMGLAVCSCRLASGAGPVR